MKSLFSKTRKQFIAFLGEEIGRFIGGSSITVLGSLAGGFLGYLYHLFMGRMLGPKDYGILASLLSLLYIFSVPIGTFSLVVTKFSADLKKSGAFFQKINKKVIWFSLVFFLLFSALIPAIMSFLHLKDFWPVFFIGLSMSIGFLVTFEGSVLQGKLKFLPLAVGGTAGAVIKLFLAIIFVYFGLGVSGSVLPMVIMAIFTYFYFRHFLTPKKKATDKEEFPSSGLTDKEIWDYSWPVFLFTLSFALLYSIDVVFARHFLSPQEAGWYGSLSTLGKVIYFLINPLTIVLFPMASQKKSNQEDSRRLFSFSFSLAALIAFLLTFTYFGFPNLIVGLLYGHSFLPASHFLGLFGVFLGFYSLAYFLANFMLSQEKTKAVTIFPVLAVLLQITVISLFHQGIMQILEASIIASGLLFFCLLMYYWINRSREYL